MRLTKKQDKKNYPYVYSGTEDYFEGEPINKLGQLEDIEEELGIDLITFHKALKDGIWHITSNGKVIGYLNVKWNWCIGRDYFKTKYGNFYFKDYGKTWALTKEELTNGK